MRLIAKNSLWVALIALFSAGAVRAQVEAIGGPYTKDANTILLMHFDGNLVNEADFSADGVGQGNYSFVSVSADPSLGQSIRFDNDAISDLSYVWVADTSYLDLTGDWTLEGWINVFTYGETSSDHRWVPRLLIKTGDEVFWRPNYWIELWGDFRFFSSGYHTVTQDAWPQVNTPNNFATPGQWVHIAFIRDTARRLLISFVHDQNRQLIDYKEVVYDTAFTAADYTPITTSKPLHIGYAGGGGDSYLDGFIDEVRISNIVRNFAVTGVGDEYGNGLPGRFELLQNYPNPFNPLTTIQFIVPDRQNVQLVVYDLLGRKVKTLVDKEMEVGKHTVTWDGRNEIGLTAASGLYFYRLNADKFVQVRKMSLLR